MPVHCYYFTDSPKFHCFSWLLRKFMFSFRRWVAFVFRVLLISSYFVEVPQEYLLSCKKLLGFVWMLYRFWILTAELKGKIALCRIISTLLQRTITRLPCLGTATLKDFTEGLKLRTTWSITLQPKMCGSWNLKGKPEVLYFGQSAFKRGKAAGVKAICNWLSDYLARNL